MKITAHSMRELTNTKSIEDYQSKQFANLSDCLRKIKRAANSGASSVIIEVVDLDTAQYISHLLKLREFTSEATVRLGDHAALVFVSW